MFLDGGQQGLKKKNRPGGELMRTRAPPVRRRGEVEAPFHPTIVCLSLLLYLASLARISHTNRAAPASWGC